MSRFTATITLASLLTCSLPALAQDPVPATVTADAEIRALREEVASLRRVVEEQGSYLAVDAMRNSKEAAMKRFKASYLKTAGLAIVCLSGLGSSYSALQGDRANAMSALSLGVVGALVILAGGIYEGTVTTRFYQDLAKAHGRDTGLDRAPSAAR